MRSARLKGKLKLCISACFGYALWAQGNLFFFPSFFFSTAPCNVPCLGVPNYETTAHAKGYGHKINNVCFKRILENWYIGWRSACREHKSHLSSCSALLFLIYQQWQTYQNQDKEEVATDAFKSKGSNGKTWEAFPWGRFQTGCIHSSRGRCKHIILHKFSRQAKWASVKEVFYQKAAYGSCLDD